MNCPKCNSENVRVELVNHLDLRTKKKGILYWFFIGWWLEFTLWVFLTLPMIIIKIFKPKNYKIKNEAHRYVVCNDCGYSGKLK